MANKRVADILARTYFSEKSRAVSSVPSSQKGMLKVARYYNLNLLLVGLNLFLVVVLLMVWKFGWFSNRQQIKAIATSQEILVTQRGIPVIIGYDFTKKESGATVEYFLNVGSVDVSDFKALVFDVRFSNGKGNSIRVEFVNNFREVGEVGIPELGESWKEVVISLKDVPKIFSWNQVQQIGFIIDKWNVASSKGSVYISNVRFVKEI